MMDYVREIKDEFMERGNSSSSNQQQQQQHQQLQVVVPAELQGFERCVDEIVAQVTTIGQKVVQVENFYTTKENVNNTSSKTNSISKDNNNNNKAVSDKQHQLLHDASQRQLAASKRTIELMRQFTLIFRQITQHKWAWPFMEPVDVEGLGLHDYNKFIEKPMDFSTIRKKMEAKDGSYKNVRDIYSDVRLVFKNAMKYNDERDDVHVMAKTLLEKFEEKWLLILPKVAEEEKRRAEEEAKARKDMKLAQEVANVSMARELSNELYDIDMQLEKLREMVVQKCRKMTTGEKKKLSTVMSRLSAEELSKALEIVGEHNPGFQPSALEVNLDMDAQSEVTLWRLKMYVQEVLKVAGKCSGQTGGQNNGPNENKNCPKRKRDITCDASTKTAPKRTKKAAP
ncbi:hypothetical protein ACFE04_029481 [Oxalis oulophora]